MKRLQAFLVSLATVVFGLVLAHEVGHAAGSADDRLARAGMPPPAAGDGGLDGIYAGTEQRQSFSAYTRSLQTQWIDWIYYFSPEGYYMRAAPNPAKDTPDWAAEVAKLKAYDYGRYSFRGAQLALRPANGVATTPYPARLEGGRLNLGGYYLWRVPPARDAAMLHGRWNSTGIMSLGDGAGTTGSASSSAVWEFRPAGGNPNEGTYAVRTGGQSSYGGGSASGRAGTWQFRSSKFGGGWLELREQNRAGSGALSVLWWPNAPDVVFIDNRKFNRVK